MRKLIFSPGRVEAAQRKYPFLSGEYQLVSDASSFLMMVSICEQFHKFPLDGGLFDQDFLFVDLLTSVLVWKEQKAELDRSKNRAVQRHS